MLRLDQIDFPELRQQRIALYELLDVLAQKRPVGSDRQRLTDAVEGLLSLAHALGDFGPHPETDDPDPAPADSAEPPAPAKHGLPHTLPHAAALPQPSMTDEKLIVIVTDGGIVQGVFCQPGLRAVVIDWDTSDADDDDDKLYTCPSGDKAYAVAFPMDDIAGIGPDCRALIAMAEGSADE